MQVIFFKKKNQFILMSLLNKPENSHMQTFSFRVLRRKKGAPSPPSPGAVPGSSQSWWLCRNLRPRWIQRSSKSSREGQKQSQLPCPCWGHSLSFTFFFSATNVIVPGTFWLGSKGKKETTGLLVREKKSSEIEGHLFYCTLSYFCGNKKDFWSSVIIVTKF